MGEALAQAREARLEILAKMRETIAESRPELSRYAPRMYRIQIPQEKIGMVIGPGGRVIRSIVDETKCTIDVEDDGTVFVGSTSQEMADRAIDIIKGLTREAEVGTIYTGKVTRLMNFGAFVEIMPGKEGLVHISELADYRVPSVEDVVKVGDEIMVMVTEIDSLGRINLSRRAVLEGAAGGEEAPAPGNERSPTAARSPSEQPRRRPGYAGSSQRRRGDGRPMGGQPRGGPDAHGRPRRRPHGQGRDRPEQRPGSSRGGPPNKPPFGRRW